jgi:phosphoribosyl 1,2-cyclic phosphodiesterase
VKLTFLGTRGYIDQRSPRHQRHSALLVSYRGRSVMIDCGEDWRGKLAEIGPSALVLTHGHPDHAFGLQSGAGCPVYATATTWQLIEHYPITVRREIAPRRPIDIEGMAFEAFPVAHSIRAPAVGFRITAGRSAIFYVPDVVYIEDRARALDGVRLYIGDAATMARPLVRRRGDALIGHTPVRTQLTWCSEAGVPRAIFTHCGSEIVGGEEDVICSRLEEFARERGVEAALAHDGMEVVLR